MKNFTQKYEIWIFLILAPIVNIIFVYITTKGLLSDFAYDHGRFFLLLLLLLVVVLSTRGMSGIIEVFKPMFKWKVNPLWYVFSLLFAFSIATITLVFKSFYTGTEFSSLFELDLLHYKGVITFLIWAFVGEVVWVSYSVRQLSKTTTLFYSSQIVGIFWTLWWLPIVFLNISVISDLPVVALLLNMMGAAGMCTFVYIKTKSGICVWLLQFMLNISILILPVSPAVGGAPTYTIFSIIYFVTMLAFMYFLNSKKVKKVKKTVN